jgi:serine/threonine protein kinase
MGEVYEAFDQLMDRRVALKTVLCTVVDRPRASRRFKEEVRNAQRVAHAHVCRINELQEHRDGRQAPALPFFTMEFIDGERLGRRLAAGRLPLADVRAIALQLLAGLEAAHERGVLHLDFKSDNVMLREGSAVPDAVIMDFGLSRVLDGESRVRTSERRQLAGTLSYMSVEQLECRGDLGPATDVYAFGVVLYEMLSGKLPFEGETLGATLLKQLRERPPAPSHARPGLAPALDRFVLKCLSSDPLQRYADASQALAALEAIDSWSRPHGLTRAWKLALPIALGGLLTLLVQRNTQRTPTTALTAPTALAASGASATSAASGASAASTAPTGALQPAPALRVGPATPEAGRRDIAALPASASKPGIPVLAAPPLPAAQPLPASSSPRAQPDRLRRPTSHTSSSNGAAQTAGPRTAPDAQAIPAASVATPSSAADPGWKPAHVPRRLSAPSP